MDVQELERNAGIRIKFASINASGGYDFDAHLNEEYKSLFPQKKGKLEDGWEYVEVDELIETRFENIKTAWVLRHVPTETEIVAVEHETGIELLIIEIVAGVATAAIVGFAKWAWGKWNESRSNFNKGKPGFIRERVTGRFPDGKIQSVERLELRPPVDSETVNPHIEESFVLA